MKEDFHETFHQCKTDKLTDDISVALVHVKYNYTLVRSTSISKLKRQLDQTIRRKAKSSFLVTNTTGFMSAVQVRVVSLPKGLRIVKTNARKTKISAFIKTDFHSVEFL